MMQNFSEHFDRLILQENETVKLEPNLSRRLNLSHERDVVFM